MDYKKIAAEREKKRAEIPQRIAEYHESVKEYNKNISYRSWQIYSWLCGVLYPVFGIACLVAAYQDNGSSFPLPTFAYIIGFGFILCGIAVIGALLFCKQKHTRPSLTFREFDVYRGPYFLSLLNVFYWVSCRVEWHFWRGDMEDQIEVLSGKKKDP